ncbi:MAG TPA: sigma-70 family RNA polymerase sigma factor [Chitinophagaceae bacterium]|nr:sigma-70 family RNA polymerase sigma factor [Chitinophagaceae bacterium]
MAEDKKIHQDQRYIEGLLHDDERVIDEIYKRFSQKIKRWIMNNSGSVAEAGDVFQEAVIVVYKQSREKDLKLTCPFEAYLMAIVKRMWFKMLKTRGRRGVTIDLDDVYNVGTSNIEEMEEALAQEEKESKIMNYFETLGERCKEIIRLCLKKGAAQEEIAEQLGLSYGYLRKKKSKCMAALVQKVKSAGLKG